jgi:hypothetical protein
MSVAGERLRVDEEVEERREQERAGQISREAPPSRSAGRAVKVHDPSLHRHRRVGAALVAAR